MPTVIRGQFIKILHNPAVFSQPFGQKLGASKPGFYGAWRTPPFPERERLVYQCPY